MTHIKTCGRCDSKILEQSWSPQEKMQFCRTHKDRSYECEDIRLCSMCEDELWEFVFNTEIDRSDKADPIGIEKMSESVKRHIEALEGVLDQLEEKLDD